MNATAILGLPGGTAAMLATPALPDAQSILAGIMPPAVPQNPGEFSDVMAALLDAPAQSAQAAAPPEIDVPAQPEAVSPKESAFKAVFSGASLTNIFSDVAADPQKPTVARKPEDTDAAAPGQASSQENVAAIATAPPPSAHTVYDIARHILPEGNPGVRPAQATPKGLALARPQIGNRKDIAFELQLKTKAPEAPKPPAPEKTSIAAPARKDAPTPAPATSVTGASQPAPEPPQQAQERPTQPEERPTPQAQERPTPQADALDAPAKPRAQADTHEEPRRESDDTAPGPENVSRLDHSASFNEIATPAPAVAARPVDTMPAREPLHAAPAAQALRTSEPALPNPISPRAAAQDISVRISRAEAPSVDLRLTQRAGDVHVSVRTMDTGLQVSLRQDLNSLVTSLNRAGYHAEAIAPREAAQMNSQNGREESQPGSQNGRQWGGDQPQDQGQRRGHTRRQWMEWMENAQ